MPVNGGAAVVRALEAEGVEVVFGIPGTHNLEIYRHLAGSAIRHVTPRHEQGAGYAADGYARVSGRSAVCVTTGGPGLTNIATAVATAYADSVPMLVISPGSPRGTVGADLGLLHEMREQQTMMAGIVDRAVRVESAAEAAAAIRETFALWSVSRPRPVYIEVPVDVLEEEWDGRLPEAPGHTAPPLDTALIVSAAQQLALAERPAIVLGGGARGAAFDALVIAERIGAPVVTSVNGKGIVPESHRLSLGASLRTKASQELLMSADIVLAVGTELGDSDLWGGELSFQGDVIRVDIDREQIAKNAPAALGLVGDAAAILASVSARLVAIPASEHSQEAALEKARVAIARELTADGDIWRDVQHVLRGCFQAPVIVAGDSAMVSYFGTAHHWTMGPRDRFLYPTGFATLGYGLPAAIGAMMAAPGADVIVVVGDGGFMFSVEEIVTAVEQKLALPIVVLNNGGYRAIRDQMVERDIAPLGVDLVTPRFGALAEACGARGIVLDGLGNLATAVQEALLCSGPTVIEVQIQ